MNDEQFEHAIGHFIPEIQEQMRFRDTAQREALARVEAEAGRLAEAGLAAHVKATAAQAQLAEAVGLLKHVKDWFGWGDLPESLSKLDAFLARQAQAEQREATPCRSCNDQPDQDHPGTCSTCHKNGWDQDAQCAQAGDDGYAPSPEERAADFDIRDRVEGRAALATQPAAGTTSDQYRAELYDEVWQNARSMGYGNVTDALSELERFKLAQAAAGKPAAVVEQTDYPYPVSSQIDVPLPVGTQLYTIQPAAVRGAEHE